MFASFTNGKEHWQSATRIFQQIIMKMTGLLQRGRSGIFFFTFFCFVSLYFCLFLCVCVLLSLCLCSLIFVFVFPFLISSIFFRGRELRLSLASLAMLGGACLHPAKCSLGETSTFQNDESIGSIQSIKSTESIESTKSTNRVLAVLAWEGQ